MSIRQAIGQLGLGKTYHMQEIFLNPDHVGVWERLLDGTQPDWQSFLGDYVATLDGPACFYWREIWHTFPDAGVLLLLRDPREWYESMMQTIYPTLTSPALNAQPAIRMIHRLLLDQFMNGRFEDEAYAINRYRAYCEEVMRDVPEEKLLVYRVTDGWQPLCQFLGCDVPDLPFPARNTTAEFRARAKLDGG